MLSHDPLSKGADLFGRRRVFANIIDVCTGSMILSESGDEKALTLREMRPSRHFKWSTFPFFSVHFGRLVNLAAQNVHACHLY